MCTSALRLSLITAALALAAVWCGPAAAIDRRVRIINESGHNIVAFYGVTVGVDEWRESLLGDDILPAGGSIILNFDDGSGYCRYRFRAVFADGIELVRDSVNVCDIGTYRYTE
jgi:hypothetical protein